MRHILGTLLVAVFLMVILRVFVPASFYTGSAIVLGLATLRILWILIFRRKAA